MSADSLLASARAVAQAFAFDEPLVDVQPFGSGLINATFLVRCGPAKPTQYILQRINRRVFTQPEQVMANLETVLTHVARTTQHGTQPRRQLAFPVTVRTHKGETFHLDAHHELWRAASFIPNTHSLDQLQNPSQAQQIGSALGCFHRLLADLPHQKLHDTLPGFHITPLYLHQYDLAPRKTTPVPQLEAFCHEFIAAHREWVPELESERVQGTLPTRIIHGDPKVNNFLFSHSRDEVISLIDLDTVKPGLVHYDLGDCLRSACNRAGEDPVAGTPIVYDINFAAALLTGYFDEACAFMTRRDFELCYAALRLIPLELGIRFFTDYLNGNLYFRVRDSEQNLRKASTQFQLVASIEMQSHALKNLIDQCRRNSSR